MRMNVPSSYHMHRTLTAACSHNSRHSRVMNVSVDCEARSFDPDIVRGQGSDSKGLVLQVTLLNSSREYYR